MLSKMFSVSLYICVQNEKGINGRILNMSKKDVQGLMKKKCRNNETDLTNTEQHKNLSHFYWGCRAADSRDIQIVLRFLIIKDYLFVWNDFFDKKNQKKKKCHKSDTTNKHNSQ